VGAIHDGLLRFLRMELRLPGLRPINQNIDPSEHSLVGDRRRDAAVMFDVAVELDALLTHSLVSHLRAAHAANEEPARRGMSSGSRLGCDAALGGMRRVRILTPELTLRKWGNCQVQQKNPPGGNEAPGRVRSYGLELFPAPRIAISLSTK
jgi:hypothetical protein